MDSYQERTNQSWMSRLGGSIKGIILGLILILVASVMLFWNEGRAVKRSKALNSGEKLALTIDPNLLKDDMDGALVHLSGHLESSDHLQDPDFDIRVENVLRFRRTVWMFQWIEKKSSKDKKKVGGSVEKNTTYTYIKDWSEKLHPSEKFKVTEGHVNPAGAPYSSFIRTVGRANVGKLEIDGKILQNLHDFQPMEIPGTLSQSGRVVNETHGDQLKQVLFMGKGTWESPQIGDVKIGFELVSPAEYTLVGGMKEQRLLPYTDDNQQKITLVEKGKWTKEEMFQKAQSSNTTTTWIFRLIGMVALFFGWYMIGKPLVILGDVVPVIGQLIGTGLAMFSGILTIVWGFAIIAVAWLFYRPLLSVVLLVIAGLIYYYFGRKKSLA